MIKNVCWSSCKVLLFLSGFNKTEIFSTYFLIKLNIQFNENPSAETELFHRTDRHDETNSRFWQFCQRA